MATHKATFNKNYLSLLRKYKCLKCVFCEHEQFYFLKNEDIVILKCTEKKALIEMCASDIFQGFEGCDKFKEMEKSEDMMYGYERKTVNGNVVFNKDVDIKSEGCKEKLDYFTKFLDNNK